MFDVCAGCRMCFKYCDTFPKLFAIADGEHDGDARALTRARDRRRSFDDCFQCKQCEVSARTRRATTTRSRSTSPSSFTATRRSRRAARASRCATRARRTRSRSGSAARLGRRTGQPAEPQHAHRLLLEKTLGIHRDKLLPDVRAADVRGVGRREAGPDQGRPGRRGRALPELLRARTTSRRSAATPSRCCAQNGVDVRCVARPRSAAACPAWECGDLRELRRARAPQPGRAGCRTSRRAAKVVAIGPTCAMMLRREYPTLVGPADRERAAASWPPPCAIRASTCVSMRKERAPAPTDFGVAPGERVAYHVACHLRAQAIGFRARDLLARRIRGRSCPVVRVLRPRRHLRDEGRELRGGAPHRPQGVRRHAGAGRRRPGSPIARSPPSRSSRTPGRSRCIRCRCSPAPTAATRSRRRRGDPCDRCNARRSSTRDQYEQTPRFCAGRGAARSSAPAHPRRPLPDVPVREHDAPSGTRSRR